MDKPLGWLREAMKTPPWGEAARVEAGSLLRQVQRGTRLVLPHSRPMKTIAKRCHELRVKDTGATWRIIYRIDPDAIIILEWFDKDTQKTPNRVIGTCKQRLARYDRVARGRK